MATWIVQYDAPGEPDLLAVKIQAADAIEARRIFKQNAPRGSRIRKLYVHHLERAADAAKACLPKESVFVLISYEEGRANYVSNGKREDCIKALKELLFRWGAEEDWMQHIK